uniref:Uncharacterized protein n=1 Tax=Arundo donax TaxID=35708 RepID=A0A0A8YD40_ARUDO
MPGFSAFRRSTPHPGHPSKYTPPPSVVFSSNGADCSAGCAIVNQLLPLRSRSALAKIPFSPLVSSPLLDYWF